MKNEKMIRVLLSVSMILFGGLIVAYFWSHETIEAILYVPMHVMIFALVYILLQIVKRFLFKERNWWDWLYYIGLAALVVPRYFISEDNLSMFNSLIAFGTLFLIIPVLMDGKKLMASK